GVERHDGVEPVPALIRRLSPEFDSIKMSKATKQPDAENEMQETFVVKVDDTEYKILKERTTEPATGNASSLSFKGAGFSFFRDALQMKNYKIVNDDSNENIKLLIYRSPRQTYWRIAGRFDSYDAALKARNGFVNNLRKINLQSEGFHVVEHVLLKPHLQSKQYGFRIFDDHRHLQLVHNDWTSFEERDKHIAKLLDFIRTRTGELHVDFENEFEGICKIAVDHGENPKHFVRPSLLRQADKEKKVNLRDIYHRLELSLEDLAASGSKGYFRIKPMALLSNKSEVAEDFFNFRITIVLPSWSARFRDIPFREFVQKLFIEHCPAHIRLNFLWLDIDEMRSFEDKYFEWLEELNKDKSSRQVTELADNLVAQLYDPKDH
ncbi:MAG TPA: hypothetical protein VKH37_08340, partial [Ferruginibacter sp.]|nr:hypothetical protein [Ferruginibacter sp.]